MQTVFFWSAHLDGCIWPNLQEVGVYLSPCNHCSGQPGPYTTLFTAGMSGYSPLGILRALSALRRKPVFPALTQVHCHPYRG